MRKNFSSFVLLLIFIFTSLNIFAASVTDAEKKAVTKAITKLEKEVDKKLPITDISPSPIPGILQVTSDVTVFYATTDGKYILFGDMLDPNLNRKNWSLTDKAMRALRAKALAAIPLQDMIIYPATTTKVGNAYVFTDIDCSYCQKMQRNIKEYTDQGIEIRYLAFPRSGINTPSYKKEVAIWCAPDKAAAYTNAIENKIIPEKTCSKNPVKQQLELGEKLGVSGTPTIFLDNGTRIGGMVDAKNLLKIMLDARD